MCTVTHEGEIYERLGWNGDNLGTWQSPSLIRKISIKHGKKAEDYFWYHRKMVEWASKYVCRDCNEFTGGKVCHCENEE